MAQWRQKLHLEPVEGWMNDPNGLCFFEGKYHVYFQYSPGSPEGATLRCWAHYESPDFLNWEYKGVVMRPDIPEDRTGVFSGSAVVHEGKLHFFYTGNVEEEGDFDYVLSGRQANEIHVTTTNPGVLEGKKVVLRNEDYPDFCSCHVRDPKVWISENTWHMVLGARTKDDHGLVLFYEAENPDEWRYVNSASIPDFGFMWECPDLFDIDGNQYLSLSPQGLERGEYAIQNLFSSGHFKYDKKTNTLSDFEEWDYGFDFYAPQTFKTPDGRRVIIGWMGIGDDSYSNPTTKLGWQHCLTLPREVSVAEDGGLIQWPIRELDSLLSDKVQVVKSGEEIKVKSAFDLTCKVNGSSTITIGDVKVQLLQDRVFLIPGASGYGRTIRRVMTDKTNDVRIVVDTSSIEIYINGGRKVMGTRFYPSEENIVIKAEGTDVSLRKYKDLED